MMKNCPAFEDLMAFADGELPEKESSAVRAHLAGCGACRRLLETQGMLEEAYRNSFEAPSEESFRLLEKRIMASNPERARRFRIPAAIPIAAALLIAVAGIRLVSGGRERFLPDPSVETVMVTEGYGAGGGLPADDSTSAMPHDAPPSAEEAALSEELRPGEREEAVPDAFDAVSTLDAMVSFSVEQVPESDLSAGRSSLEERSRTAATGSAGVVGAVERSAGTPDMDDRPSRVSVGESSTPVPPTHPAAGGTDFFAGSATASDEAGSAGEAGSVERGRRMDRIAQERGAGAEIPECVTLDRQSENAFCEFRGGMLTPAPEKILVVFGSDGEPCSPDSAFLDASFPGWKDSLEGDMADSAMVFTVDEFSRRFHAVSAED